MTFSEYLPQLCILLGSLHLLSSVRGPVAKKTVCPQGAMCQVGVGVDRRVDRSIYEAACWES